MLEDSGNWLKEHTSVRGVVMAAVTAIVVSTIVHTPDSAPAYMPKSTERTDATVTPRDAGPNLSGLNSGLSLVQVVAH